MQDNITQKKTSLTDKEGLVIPPLPKKMTREPFVPSEKSNPDRRGIVVSCSNYKGGTGKTTVATNLSAGLALAGKKVLLIDNDPQSDSTRAVTKADLEIDACLYDLLALDEDVVISDCIYPTIHKNLFVLPNVTETAGLEIPLAKKFPESNWYLRNAVYDFVTTHFDYIFIDCPPTLSIFVSNAFYASDAILIPVTVGSSNSIHGVKGILTLMEDVRQMGNDNLRFLKILANNLDGRKTRIHHENMHKLNSLFGSESVFKQHIPSSSDFESVEALNHNTIFSYARTSYSAQTFRKITAEFLEIFEGVGNDGKA